MEELVNELKEDGKLTEKILTKKEAHKNGICHGISVVALIDKKGRLLIQKRSIKKSEDSGKWALSIAGHISLNESAINAAVRETYEEIGIKISKSELKLLDTFLLKKRNNMEYINHFTYLFLVSKDIDLNSIIMQKDEVDEVCFVNKDEYLKLIKNNCMVESVKYCDKILDYMN